MGSKNGVNIIDKDKDCKGQINFDCVEINDSKRYIQLGLSPEFKPNQYPLVSAGRTMTDANRFKIRREPQ